MLWTGGTYKREKKEDTCNDNLKRMLIGIVMTNQARGRLETRQSDNIKEIYGLTMVGAERLAQNAPWSRPMETTGAEGTGGGGSRLNFG